MQYYRPSSSVERQNRGDEGEVRTDAVDKLTGRTLNVCRGRE